MTPMWLGASCMPVSYHVTPCTASGLHQPGHHQAQPLSLALFLPWAKLHFSFMNTWLMIELLGTKIDIPFPPTPPSFSIIFKLVSDPSFLLRARPQKWEGKAEKKRETGVSYLPGPCLLPIPAANLHGHTCFPHFLHLWIHLWILWMHQQQSGSCHHRAAKWLLPVSLVVSQCVCYCIK